MVEKSEDRPDKEAAPEQQNFDQDAITKPGVVSAKNENTNTYKRTEPAQNLFVLPVPAESLLLTSYFDSFYLWIILPSAVSCQSLASKQRDGDA